MNKDQLITKQQLLIVEMKKEIEEMKESFLNIHNSLFCVGAPLNDNILQFNKE